MKKILIVEDDIRIAAALEVRFQNCGYAVVVANDAIQAARFALNSQPDLIILDISLPAGNGLMLAERFQSAEATRGVPIIFITASKDPRLRERALELNAAGFFEKPYDVAELLAEAGKALCHGGARANRGEIKAGKAAKKILIIEDDARIGAATALRFQAAGYRTEIAFDALLGLQNAVQHLPDLVLLDISMPAGDGFEVAERIQKAVPHPPPMIFLTASKRHEFRQRAQALGAAAYFEKPYEAEDLVRTVNEILGFQPTPDN
jgi:DNA-binding response OmpR family regulator